MRWTAVSNDDSGRQLRASLAPAVRQDGAAGARGEGEITLAVPGYHNLMNALAAVSVGLELGVPFATEAGVFQQAGIPTIVCGPTWRPGVPR